MPRKQLQEALDALHRELESDAELGREDRKALLEAAREIGEALSKADAGAVPDKDEPLERVSDLIEDFEKSHPQLAEILSNLSKALSNLGI